MLFANVCAGFISFCHGVCRKRRCPGILGAPGGFIHMESASFASLLPCVRGTWATQPCLTLDPPFGRRSVGALSSLLCRSSPDNWEVRLFGKKVLEN